MRQAATFGRQDQQARGQARAPAAPPSEVSLALSWSGGEDSALALWSLLRFMVGMVVDHPIRGSDDRARNVPRYEAMAAGPGVGSIQFEQNALVTVDGIELLTTIPTRF